MLKKVFSIGTLLICLFSFNSCHDHHNSDAKGDLTIRFQLTYDGKPLEMFKNYAYPTTGDSLFFSRVSFYLSNLSLNAPGHDHFLKDIDYLNVTASHVGALAKDGYSYKFKDVPVHAYDKLVFDIGVPSGDNAKNPNDFPSTSPLSFVAEYWSAWKSYIFFRPEGKIAKAGSLVPDQNFALHLGGDSANTSFFLAKSIDFKADVENIVDVKIDMAKFFSSTTTYDIRANRQIHSPNQEPLVVALAKNLEKAVQ